MGQRTQMLISFTGYDDKGQAHHKLYYTHHQWGYGSIMPKNIMAVVMRIMNSNHRVNSEYCLNERYSNHCKEYQNLNAEERFQLRMKNLDIENTIVSGFVINDELSYNKMQPTQELTFEMAKKILQSGDNNDGVCFLKIIEKTKFEYEIGFAFARAEDLEYGVFCSLEDYLNEYEKVIQNKNELELMFKMFCVYYKVKDIHQLLNRKILPNISIANEK